MISISGNLLHHIMLKIWVIIHCPKLKHCFYKISWGRIFSYKLKFILAEFPMWGDVFLWKHCPFKFVHVQIEKQYFGCPYSRRIAFEIPEASEPYFREIKWSDRFIIIKDTHVVYYCPRLISHSFTTRSLIARSYLMEPIKLGKFYDFYVFPYNVRREFIHYIESEHSVVLEEMSLILQKNQRKDDFIRWQIIEIDKQLIQNRAFANQQES